MSERDPRRQLPSVDALLRDPDLVRLGDRHGRALVRAEARAVLAAVRSGAPRPEDLAGAIAERTRSAARPSLRPVVNATGVVVHTNLGRAPLPRAALDRAAAVLCGYSNLEYDLAQGSRGRREVHAERRLARLLGCEATLVVNNNAAAVLLVVDTLASGREVVISRGELVEIGGSFRVPDVIARGGARLREVGTTNRTRLADYRAALGPDTALLLKVHPSNFAVSGFTESVAIGPLCALGQEAGLPVVEDLGSGLLRSLPPPLDREPTAEASLAAGAELCTFSGDKLLGGPQAGVVAGRAATVARLRRNPLYRALRVDKLTMAVLDAVLEAHEAEAWDEVPVRRLLALDPGSIERRAAVLAQVLADLYEVRTRVGVSLVGGGAAPDVGLPTTLLELRHPTLTAQALAARLRHADPPVVARVADDHLVVDLRTVFPEQEDALRAALRAAAGEAS